MRRFGVTAKATKAIMTNANMSKLVLNAEYACRGAIVTRANEIQKAIKENPNHGFNFEKVIMCNIGNPQELGGIGAVPPTYPRQILAGVMYPELLNHNIFPNDVEDKINAILNDTPCRSMGAYTHSQGLLQCRKWVAEFIANRDNVDCNPEDIFLTDGASPGIKYILQMCISGPEHGCMVPIPQYPLYSGSVSLLNGSLLGYGLDEENDWAMDFEKMDKVANEARAKGVQPRCLAVINPGNPTGNCLTEDSIKAAIQLAKDHGMALLADEVYQENIYGDRPFISFRSVLDKMGPAYNDVELVSFHSVSKGVFGECGLRGGYLEMRNIHPEGKEQLYKFASISLCSNTAGQVITGVMCSLPKPGEASYESHTLESKLKYESLARRSKLVSKKINEIEGVTCNHVKGALYAFPKIKIPAKAQEIAKSRGIAPDAFYSLSVLEEQGICTVPGSGFGQEDGTFHFRTTILPPEEEMEGVCDRLKTFHEGFIAKYS